MSWPAPRNPEALGLSDAVARIRRWGERRDWRGWDPYDGLTSPAAPFLTLRTRMGRRLLTQAVKLSPLNLRPLLGIKPRWNAKAIGLVATAYARLAAATDDPAATAAVTRWLDWLEASPSPDTAPGLAWGYHFPVQTRVFRYGAGEPNAIATAFAGQAFLDAAELLGEARVDAIDRTASFLVRNLRSQGADGAHFLYLRGRQELVHNANLLVCAFLVRAARTLGEERYADAAAGALPATLGAQRPDGSWPYADAHGWVDNFHTGYVLESLAACADLHAEAVPALRRGLAFWERELFLADGTPRYDTRRTYPLDAHCYAQAIETWLAVQSMRSDALLHAERAADLLIRRMLDDRGFVHFQEWPRWRSRVPYVRWSTAPAFRALARLLLARMRTASTGKEVLAARLD